ncbi:hypothetical protein V3C99_017793 [Haemonchus contortus]
MPLCLTFIDFFNTVETGALNGALGNHGVPTRYVKILRELYNNFMTTISSFYKEVIINVKRGVHEFPFMRNVMVPDAPFTLKGTNISECSSQCGYDWVPWDVKRTPGRAPPQMSDLFTKALSGRDVSPPASRASTILWTTLIRDRDEWRRNWRLFEEIDDQLDNRQ